MQIIYGKYYAKATAAVKPPNTPCYLTKRMVLYLLVVIDSIKIRQV